MREFIAIKKSVSIREFYDAVNALEKHRENKRDKDGKKQH